MQAVGSDATMNVPGGFAGEVSLSYSSPEAATVNVYSEIGLGGRLLGTFRLMPNLSACTDVPYCNWTRSALVLNDVARSIGFGATANVTAFDDVVIRTVPEPVSLGLLALGLGVGIVARAGRRERA